VIYAIAFVLLAGFVAVTLADRRRKHRRAVVAIQGIDLDPPADLPDDPDPEPDPWPPTR